MAATTTAPIFPMSGHFQFDHFGLGPEMDYAQVLAEAQRTRQQQQQQKPKDNISSANRTARRPDLVSDISCFSGHFRAAAAEEQNLKTNRRSWKSSLFFWRKAQKKHLKNQCSSSILTPQHPVFKSRCKPASSGPLYMNDVRSGPSYCRSGRAASTPLAAALLKGDAGIPYMSLNHHRSRPVARPLYLVT